MRHSKRGKLPYPAFLETAQAKLFGKRPEKTEETEIWSGNCIFFPQRSIERNNDGNLEKGTAKAIIRFDISDYYLEDLRFAAGQTGEAVLVMYLIKQVTPAFNPDGSLHHVLLMLEEMPI